MDPFTGRKREKELLNRVYRSEKPELVAIYGRRRVGKTCLVRNFFSETPNFFEVTGVRKAKLKEQLLNFSHAFANFFQKEEPINIPSSWNEAFTLLVGELESVSSKKRFVLFFDELPWLASPKSDFMTSLEYFWNRYFSRDHRLIVILCGSASSWMIRKVINNRGGLYGRLTRTIRLLPFQIAEVEEYLKARSIHLDRKQIQEIYMVIGGIPHYLSLIERGMSSTTAINELFFTPNAQLSSEFDRVFRSLFDNYENHIKIIRALATKTSGLTKGELLKKASLTSGGNSTKMIQELEESGFIASIPDYGHKKTGYRYILVDEYTLFYITWVEEAQKSSLVSNDPEYWLKMHPSQRWKSWSGYAFEILCKKHIQEIKKALGISGVITKEAGWQWLPPKGSSETGAQIDLIIDRADRCINLVEMKFSEGPFVITKKYASELNHKKNLFRTVQKTSKTIYTTLLTTQGVIENSHAIGAVDQQLTIDLLFNP